ncbi:MAG: Bud site selection protein bud4 [Piccolia ochrophora]|nr:MAG: Bud site selection protein bud4 [Piccolia ochrophora]
MNGAYSRPLAELGPMERRRNSPSFNQTTKKPLFDGDSSPFDPSPSTANVKASPRLFWQGRDQPSPSRFNSENSPLGHPDESPSRAKRSSIENLKRASRVKNSNMFAREHTQDYDPTSLPKVERPLAGRSLAHHLQGVTDNGREHDSPVTESRTQAHDSIFNDGRSKIPISSPATSPKKFLGDHAFSPNKSISPIKSSLSQPGKHGPPGNENDPENGPASDEDSGAERQLPPGRVLHRHAKSVTFDAAPPQINEYEMTTPEVSSIGTASRESSYDSAEDESFDHGSFLNRDDSFDASLEDIEKTPVVGPEDWRHMSPDHVQDALISPSDDVFLERESPMPEARPSSTHGTMPSSARVDSNGSNGESRPLPPVPASGSPTTRARLSNGLAEAAERVGNAQRALPSPPRPASISKSEIQGLGGYNMSLEDRLRLMMIQDDQVEKSEVEKQRERRMRRGVPREQDHSHEPERHEFESDSIEGLSDVYDLPDLTPRQALPHISRESILKRVQIKDLGDLGLSFSSSPVSSSRDHGGNFGLDPDKPLPSTETISIEERVETRVVIKQEPRDDESEVDQYSIPDLYQTHQSESQSDEEGGENSVIRHGEELEDDVESRYSQNSLGEDNPQNPPGPVSEDEGMATPRQQSPNRSEMQANSQPEAGSRMSLPEFASLLSNEDFGLGLGSYMSPEPSLSTHLDEAKRTVSEQSLLKEPITDYSETFDEQHNHLKPLSLATQLSTEKVGEASHALTDYSTGGETPPGNESTVPEPVATIKAPGGRLKTRLSVTPTDMSAMAAARRQVSGEKAPTPAVPTIPDRHRDRGRHGEGEQPTQLEGDHDQMQENSASRSTDSQPTEPKLEKKSSRRKSLIKLDMPMDEQEGDLSIGLDQEFDRLLEAKNRGYLMRQNTKVIVASSNSEEQASSGGNSHDNSAREIRSAGNSPRKSSQDRPKSWSVEPWNGKMRRKSIREAPGSPRKKPNLDGPVPPLPGQESAVSGALDSVAEDCAIEEELEEGGERGRLFVKVVGVKDLEMQLPKSQQSWFNLTLDNGIHCVQTTWLELGKNAPIGQEFELVVLEDLEFTLTLQTEPPKPPVSVTPESPTKTGKPQKQSAFSRVFGSPRKRRELEKKQQEEEQRAAREKQAARSKRLTGQATAWDLLHNVVAEDGSFGRSYFNLKEHEDQAYGRPYTVIVDCFNEWAIDEGSSVKSKRGTIQRKPPYCVGKLELQVLFVPKPKGATDADMPKSLNGCIRDLQDAEASATRQWEGHLSQQGGDCPYWRRRFFKLDGSKLTAYHEATRQPRATINLAKASKLIDDKSSLMQREGTAKKGGRRKSAFAEEEEGYMFVEEGFRIRFANGEVIDFYADSAADKDGWMRVLADAVGKEPGGSGWTAIVLGRENALKSNGAKAEQTRRQSEPGKPYLPTPRRKIPQAAATTEAPTRRSHNPGPLTNARGRANGAPKSMIF